MKKKSMILCILLSVFMINPKNVFAFDVNTYRSRNTCGNYEVAGFHSDGEIVTVYCKNTFEEAVEAMHNNGADDLAVMTRVSNGTKIVAANLGIVDLNVNGNNTVSYYRNSNETGYYTYMNHSNWGSDAALVKTEKVQFGDNYKHNARVRISDFEGWVDQDNYEILPITWVVSTSYYNVDAGGISHVYTLTPKGGNSGNVYNTIGPKPEMLNNGRYYSYDGHYFYSSINDLLKDARSGSRSRSVNKDNPYYNYYQYLSVHSKSNYSSLNIDEYIRSNLGYGMDVYGDKAESGTSRLYGMGQFLYWSQQKYGINALITLSHGINESGYGRSNIAVNKNNGFGLNAVDSNPWGDASVYGTYQSCIESFARDWMNWGYAKPEDTRYFGPAFGNKHIGMNVYYASDPYWGENMAGHYYAFDRAKGMQDYNYYQLGLTNEALNARQEPNNSSKSIYIYPERDDAIIIISETTGETVDGSNVWYEIVSDRSVDSNYNYTDKWYGYNWGKTVYVPASKVRKINTPKSGAGTYKAPQSVPKYQDAGYQYDLLTNNQIHTPQIGFTKRKSGYHRDAGLSVWAGLSAEKDRYLLIHAIAKDKNGNVVSYYVTSDYQYQQKHWIKAADVEVVAGAVGKMDIAYNPNISIPVHESPSKSSSVISGMYDYAYAPIFEEKIVDGKKWYKVPIDVDGTKRQYGWTLTSEQYVSWDVKGVINASPTITANNREVTQGIEFNKLEGVTAKDYLGNDITSSVTIKSDNVNLDVVGTYSITYKVTSENGRSAEKSIRVTVKANEKPVITATDIEIEENQELTHNYSATDKEDGDITANVVIDSSKVDTSKAGVYDLTYTVKDSYNQEVAKVVKVYVLSSGPSIRYSTHVEQYGWLRTQENGEMSGTSHESKRLEAIKVNLSNMDYEGTIEYRTHIQDIGWESEWKKNNEQSGTDHQSKRLEAIEIRLTGELADHYDVYYRVHAQDCGWMGWAKNGEMAGTAGYGRRLEAIEIILVTKGAEPPAVECRTEEPFVSYSISYTTHVQDIGWQDYVNDGMQAGTDHQSKRLEAIKIKFAKRKSGSIEYRTHIQDIGWESDWKKDDELSGTSHQSKRLEAIQIRLTGQVGEEYDVYYRVHAQNFGWMGWAKNGEEAGTAHYSYRLEAIQIVLIPKGHIGPSDDKVAFNDRNAQ